MFRIKVGGKIVELVVMKEERHDTCENWTRLKWFNSGTKKQVHDEYNFTEMRILFKILEMGVVAKQINCGINWDEYLFDD